MLLVVVCDLHLVGITIDEPEANAPLIVDTNRVLPLPILSKLMKTISWRNLEVVYSRRQVHVFKFTPRSPGDVRRKASRPSSSVKLLCLLVREGLDHKSMLTRHVTLVNSCLMIE